MGTAEADSDITVSRTHRDRGRRKERMTLLLRRVFFVLLLRRFFTGVCAKGRIRELLLSTRGKDAVLTPHSFLLSDDAILIFLYSIGLLQREQRKEDGFYFHVQLFFDDKYTESWKPLMNRKL